MDYVKLIAPAKVNLVLAVGGVREDGYHEVNTIMHALALHDILEMRCVPGYEEGKGLSIYLRCETIEGANALAIKPEENIIYKAIARLGERLGRTQDEEVEVVLTKRIPHEAGLGGGSSNAAAALRGVALLWDVDPLSDEVMEVAASLGADVPFFLRGGCAYLSGRGDVFEHALEPRKDSILLIRPEVGVSTAEAYRTFDEKGVLPTEEQLASFAAQTSAFEIEPWNNLAPAAEEIAPELRDIRVWIEQECERLGIEGAKQILCGSGSTTAVFDISYDQAGELLLSALKQGWWARVTSFTKVGADLIKGW